MPVHDWSRVDSGIFHDFHATWITGIKTSLNAGLLPGDHYALSEQRIYPFTADVVTLRGDFNGDVDPETGMFSGGGTAVLIAPPKAKPIATTDDEFYRTKQNRIAIRHVSDDNLVAVIEIVSPGNKSSRNAMREFIGKAIELFTKNIHLVIVDPHPTTKRDPEGIHGAIWEEFTDQPYQGPVGKPFTVASYEVANGGIRAFVERFAVGEPVPEIPLFLKYDGQIPLPLEETYREAWKAVPRRWRAELDAKL